MLETIQRTLSDIRCRLRLRSGRVHLAIFCVACFWGAESGAVLIATGDGAENTTNPNFFGWEYVGNVNGLSATYLGEGWVITANHVGPGDFVLDGTVYPWIQGTQVRLKSNSSTFADLVMFWVWPYPDLETLVIRTTPSPVGEFLVMIGGGLDRGPVTTWDPNGPLPAPPDDLTGFEWGSTKSKRWGTNEVEALTTGLIEGTVSFYTSFDYDNVALFPEAQAAGGDSGGAVFSINGGGDAELAGIIYAVGPTPGQPANTALFTNLTFVARLDFYRNDIEEVIALPEPTMGMSLSAGIGLLVILNRRRKRAAGSGRSSSRRANLHTGQTVETRLPRFPLCSVPGAGLRMQSSGGIRSATRAWRNLFLS